MTSPRVPLQYHRMSISRSSEPPTLPVRQLAILGEFCVFSFPHVWRRVVESKKFQYTRSTASSRSLSLTYIEGIFTRTCFRGLLLRMQLGNALIRISKRSRPALVMASKRRLQNYLGQVSKVAPSPSPRYPPSGYSTCSYLNHVPFIYFVDLMDI